MGTLSLYPYYMLRMVRVLFVISSHHLDHWLGKTETNNIILKSTSMFNGLFLFRLMFQHYINFGAHSRPSEPLPDEWFGSCSHQIHAFIHLLSITVCLINFCGLILGYDLIKMKLWPTTLRTVTHSLTSSLSPTLARSLSVSLFVAISFVNCIFSHFTYHYQFH